MHMKGEAYYYVTSTKPRKWIPLGSDLCEARGKWADLENGPRTETLVSNLIDEWLNSEKFAALADTSRSCYSSISKQVKEFFSGADVTDIKPHHIAAWMDAHPSRTQANLGRSLLSNVLTLAVRQGLIERNPAAEIKRHTIPRRERYLTDEEFLAIRSNATPVLQAAMGIGYVTAARISDILAIRLNSWTNEGLFITQLKTKKSQLFKRSPALDAAIEFARSIPRPVRGIYLLCTQKEQPYSYATLNQWWQEAVDKSGVKDAHFHDIRGKSATDTKRGGGDYQALLGHSSKAMSDRYIKLEDAQKVDALQRKIQ